MAFGAYIVYYFWQILYFLEHLKGFRQANYEIKWQELTFDRYKKVPKKYTKNFRKSEHDYSEYEEQSRRRFWHGVQTIFGLILLIGLLYPVWHFSNTYDHAFFSPDIKLVSDSKGYDFFIKMVKAAILIFAWCCIVISFKISTKLPKMVDDFYYDKTQSTNELQELILKGRYQRNNFISYMVISLFIYYLLWV